MIWNTRYALIKSFLCSLLTSVFLITGSQLFAQTAEEDTYSQTPKFTKENKVNRVGTFKGLFINNFIKYVEWPKNAVKDTFRLGVLNDEVLVKILKRTSRKKTFGPDSLPIKVFYMENLDRVAKEKVNMLYSNFELNGYSSEVLFQATKGLPTLLITENYDFGTTMINFVTIDNNQKFEIDNIAMIEEKGLKVHPKMVEYSLKTRREDFERQLVSVRTKLDKEISINVKQTKEIEDLSNAIIEKEKILKERENKLADISKNIAAQNILSKELKHLLDSNKNVVEQKEEEILISERILKRKEQKLIDAEADLKVIEEKSSQTLNALQNQRVITYVSVVVLFIVAFLLFIALRNYQKQKQQSLVIIKQKEEVEGQRDEISKQHVQLEEKNKEITDSINYAKRIQEAILPPVVLFENHLKNYFIYYLPKDIVAGDFYWMQVVGPNVIFAAADCTGHGVPGALVSTLCSNALNRAVKEYNIIEPGKILDKTLEIILDQFTQAEETVKDGMDISLCSFNTETNELQFAGANNPLWVNRKGSNEIEEYVPNKQPIGAYLKLEPFKNHSIQLNKGDSIYIFSDGYADQFGATTNALMSARSSTPEGSARSAGQAGGASSQTTRVTRKASKPASTTF